MKKTLALILLLAAATTVEAGTRLTYAMNGKPTAIAWPGSAFPITVHVTRDVSTRLPQAELAIARAMQSWQSVEESTVAFRDGGPIDARAGRDGRNAITMADRLYADSGFIAYTTNWFEDDGRIIEADIQIDPTVATNGTNLEALVQHEVGHFLGLDHSAVISSVMYPYVGEEDLGGLDSDDLIAIRTVYPRKALSELGATLRGQVRDQSGGVFGAQVVALSQHGSPVATALTDGSGRFELAGVPDGQYTLYTEPLDGPVESTNLSGIWRDGRTGFRTEFLGSRVITAQRGQVQDDLTLQLDSRPASLNPRWIGVFPANSTEVHLSSTVEKIRPGDMVSIAVGGDGFIPGFTSFEVLNQGLSRVSDFRYGPNWLWATFKVAADTPATSLVIRVANGDERAALTGAIRVERSFARRRSVRP